MDLALLLGDGHGVGLASDRIGLDILQEGDDPIETGLQGLGAVAIRGDGGNDYAALLGLDENQAGADGGDDGSHDGQDQDGGRDGADLGAARGAHDGQNDQADDDEPHHADDGL